MIIDTTYILPLARISVDKDLLKASVDGNAALNLDDVTVSLISLFELQANAVRLTVPAKHVAEAADTILKALKVEPFYNPEVLEASFELRKIIPDYIDCVILATAVSLKEDLVTEDSRILAKRTLIKQVYGVRVMSYDDIVKK